ncbi:MAG: hypothetical protein IPO08_20915 [Xanthomonadales bacterium]|nr:hypothetical protein [Xanthomonadales bacterium]MBK9496921.1 hypothetical protein [Xanthomonadales bacterium]
MELALLNSLVAAVPGLSVILMALGTLVVIGQVIVVATPSKSDDEAWEKIKSVPLIGGIISALANFAPISKK